jgi:urate oxidase
MSAVLTHHAYGKSQVRLTKVTRQLGDLGDVARHEIKELSIAIQLEGDFDATYTCGDNSRVVATDSMKNTVYVLARNHPLADAESFGQALTNHFMETYPHVAAATVRLVEEPWQRLVVAGREHPHAFTGGASEKRTCTVTQTRQGLSIESGLEGLLLLKTTDSAFRGFIRDRYTTLPETDDRIFATRLVADWLYGEPPADWNDCHRLIRQTLVEGFARHHSLSVQQTLHAMGTAALDACRQLQRITLKMTNQHRLLVNLQPFALDNPNVVFAATDEPYGLITGTVARKADG